MAVRWRVKKELLHPEFVADVDALLAADAGDWVVTYGFRTREEQAALYKIFCDWCDKNPDKPPSAGPRAAPPGQSAHESGLAVDVALVQGTKTQWDTKDPAWVRMIATVKKHPRLHSLAEIGDFDHIEKVKWRNFSGWSEAKPT